MDWTLEEAVSYYKKQGAPKDQTALTGLLKEIQQEYGGRIPPAVLPRIADAYGIKESFLLAIIRRFPSLRLGETHCLELCGGPNCSKHTALAACAEKLQKKTGNKFTLKFVPCMRMCGKGPNLRWDGQLYHKADETLILRLLMESGVDF